MNKSIKFLFTGMIALGAAMASYASNITVNWNANDVTGISLGAGGGTTPLPGGDLLEIGAFTIAPTVGSPSLANFTVFATASSGSNSIPGFFSVSSLKPELVPAHQQIYLVAFNAPTAGAATDLGIWTSTASNWHFPASSDIPNATSIDIEQLINNPGLPSASLKADAQIIYGSGLKYVANDPNNGGFSTTWLPLGIPEPSSFGLVVIALVGLAGFVRRRCS